MEKKEGEKEEEEEGEEMDSLKEEEEGKAFPSFRFWGFRGKTQSIPGWIARTVKCTSVQLRVTATWSPGSFRHRRRL